MTTLIKQWNDFYARKIICYKRYENTTREKMNEDRQQSFKKLVELTLRYDKNQIIHPNPDMANKPEAELILEKVPELVSIMLYGKSKERVHAAFGLKNLSDEKRFRIPLCLTPEFIESICAILFLEQNADAHRRCQQHALAIVNNLLLEVSILCVCL
jgi:hypothetical protein